MPYKYKQSSTQRNRRYFQGHKDLVNNSNRTYKQRLRNKIIDAYGGKCSKCNFLDRRALQIDHINGGGTKERRELSNYQIMLKITKENYPKTYQILCANCNAIKKVENKEYPKGRKVIIL